MVALTTINNRNIVEFSGVVARGLRVSTYDNGTNAAIVHIG